jgi:hypothetical protein
LKSLVQQWGTKNWKVVASQLENRTPRQCRDRWNQHLDRDFNRDEWTAEDDEQIIEGFQKFGLKWHSIAKLLSKRSASSVQKRFSYLIQTTMNQLEESQVQISHHPMDFEEFEKNHNRANYLKFTFN